MAEVGTTRFVQELNRRGIRLVVFDFDGVMLREKSPGCGLELNSAPGPHALAEGFYQLALELCSNCISMAIVTNNDRRNILPVIVSNWRWHQGPERQTDFERIAGSGVFRRVQCWDTHHGRRKDGERMPMGKFDANGAEAPWPVEKNGRIRLAVHRAKLGGAMTEGDAADDAGVGATRTLLIDDNEDNVQAFLRLGGHACVAPSPAIYPPAAPSQR
jgi:hypothetical protein